MFQMKTNINLRVSFYTRDKKDSEVEQSPIMLRVSYEGKRLNLGRLPIEVKPSLLQANRVVSSCPDAGYINRELDAVKAKLMVYAEDLYRNNALTLSRLRDAYAGKRRTSFKTIGAVFNENNEEHARRTQAGLLTQGTLRNYRRFAQSFLDFILMRYKVKDLLVSEVTVAILDEYRLYLECEGGYNHNTLIKLLRYAVNAMKYAEKKGYLKDNALRDVSYCENAVDRGFLTTEELQKVEEVELNYHFSVVRDVFLFACYTGISYRDVYNLREKNIAVMNGHPWLLFRRQKTDTLSQVYLLDKAIAILDKYLYERPYDGRLLPVYSNQVINRDLKKIAEACGIEKCLTFHLARHTFATKRPVVERFCGYVYATIQYDGGKEYPLQVDANGLYATSQRVSVVNDPNGGGLWNYIAAFNLSTIHYVTMAE